MGRLSPPSSCLRTEPRYGDLQHTAPWRRKSEMWCKRPHEKMRIHACTKTPSQQVTHSAAPCRWGTASDGKAPNKIHLDIALHAWRAVASAHQSHGSRAPVSAWKRLCTGCQASGCVRILRNAIVGKESAKHGNDWRVSLRPTWPPVRCEDWVLYSLHHREPRQRNLVATICSARFMRATCPMNIKTPVCVCRLHPTKV